MADSTGFWVGLWLGFVVGLWAQLAVTFIARNW